MAEKAKYWTAILYPESMSSDWRDTISDVLQIPFAYCIHDKDKDGHNGDRKTHVHIVLAFPNTTTYNHVLSLIQDIMPSCSTVKKVINIRYIFDYLIHDTESCRKKCKYLYDKNERILCNCFDIGAYEQRSLEDKRDDAKLLKKYIIDHKIENTFELDMALSEDSSIDDDLRERFEDALIGYSGYINNVCKGVYLYECKRRNSRSYYGG